MFARTWLELGRCALLASMASTVLFGEAFSLRRRADELYPLPALEDTLIAASEEMERPLDLVQMVELDRTGFVKSLEIRGIDKVGHRDAVDPEAQILDGICGLVSVDKLGPRLHRHVIDARIDEHFHELV